MRYIIMCGGNYHTEEPRQFKVFNGEKIIERTIRLLREHGVKDIYISATDERFEQFGVPVLKHHNTYGDGGRWLEAFYPIDEPVCYIFGDVVFSDYAIKTIVETDVKCVQFFASSPPFARNYIKTWAEPFAYKVIDTRFFRQAINKTLELAAKGTFKREPIAWELWQVIKHTPFNDPVYTNYCTINDWTCDYDIPEDYEKLKEVIE